MNELHDRINRVINTRAFEQSLEKDGVDLLDFQCDWHRISGGLFERLPEGFQRAILLGEAELEGAGELTLV